MSKLKNISNTTAKPVKDDVKDTSDSTGLVKHEPVMDLNELKESLPKDFKREVSYEMLDKVCQILSEPEMHEYYRENFLNYNHVMSIGRYRLEDYANAIKYCTYKIAGYSNRDSYIKTFPDRYQNHLDNNRDDKTIDSYVCAYHKNKMVQGILETAYIPVWLLNQDAVQEAINTQIQIMRTADSDKVRSDAANSLLNHLKPPEKNKVELDIGIKQDTGQIDDLRNAVKDLVTAQKEAIQSGTRTASDIANSKIIEDVDYEEQ